MSCSQDSLGGFGRLHVLRRGSSLAIFVPPSPAFLIERIADDQMLVAVGRMS